MERPVSSHTPARRRDAAARPGAAGFTLLEMLVALAILVTAFVVVWNTFNTTLKAWERGQEMLEGLHHGDYVMEQLAGALRSAAIFDSESGRYGFWLDNSGSGSSARDQISWVTASSAFLPPDSPFTRSLHRLEVTIEDNDDGDDSVAVRAYPHLVDQDEADPETYFISSVVNGLNCEVYNFEDEVWEDEWEDTNTVPRLVYVTLYMDPIEEFGDPLTLERVITIPVAPREPGDVVANRPGEGEGEEAAPAGGDERQQAAPQQQQQQEPRRRSGGGGETQSGGTPGGGTPGG